MYGLEDPTLKASKARIYHGKLDKILDLIVDMSLRRKKNTYKKLKEALRDLPEILAFCEMSDDIEFVHNVLTDFLEDPLKVEPVDLKNVQEIISLCKYELKKFREEIASESWISKLKIERYANELEKYIFGEEQVLKGDRIKKEIRRVVYQDPGHYLKSLQKYLSRKFGPISYSSVRYHVNDLEKKKEIITIGGPQGRYRYCFPNPERIDNRTVYYGKYFGLIGKIVEHISESDKIKVEKPRGRFLDIYVVNSNVKPVLLALPYGVADEELDEGEVTIESYGRLESYSRLLRMGYLVQDDVQYDDVLFAFKIAKVVDDEKYDLWVSDEAVLTPTYS